MPFVCCALACLLLACPSPATERRVFVLDEATAHHMLDQVGDQATLLTDDAIHGLQAIEIDPDLLDEQLDTAGICSRVEDVTSRLRAGASVQQILRSFDGSPSTSFSARECEYADQVRRALAKVDESRLRGGLNDFLRIDDRNARSKKRNVAPEWIEGYAGELSKKNRSSLEIQLLDEVPSSETLREEKTQRTVWIRLPGASRDDAIVLGAHIDTVSGSPGADDNASGVWTVLEILAALGQSGLQFERDIHFFFYAAEEQGDFSGSRAAAQAVESVGAAINFDMVGYEPLREVSADMYFWAHHVDSNLTRFAQQVAVEYVDIPVDRIDITGCDAHVRVSDHVVWYDAKVPVVFPIEARRSRLNPFANSTRDIKQVLNVDHMMRFVRLGVALVVELAQPVTSPKGS